ncbi:putative phosphoserine phosphatase 2 [mine drainage metagenome]|uniref:Putative phosphoserine phosphatase 2 n=1 Tax=mine drainage metagenome TaxID=410659 RepID=A0A1J5RYU6_9ZZZZ
MEIYLIRHTTPAVETGTCYGQSDIDVAATFQQEAIAIKEHIPGTIQQVYCSPLQRCSKLAGFLFPSHNIQWNDNLKEINCGDWEMQKWNDIPKEESNKWMVDFVRTPFPNGENYLQLHQRVTTLFGVVHQTQQSSAIITHGGVIRSILSYITQTALQNSFNAFVLHYGCVVQLIKSADGFQYKMLHNLPTSEII